MGIYQEITVLYQLRVGADTCVRYPAGCRFLDPDMVIRPGNKVKSRFDFLACNLRFRSHIISIPIAGSELVGLAATVASDDFGIKDTGIDLTLFDINGICFICA